MCNSTARVKRSTFLPRRLFAAILLLLFGVSSTASALTLTADFDGGGNGTSWNDANNWSPDIEPDNGTNTFDAVIDTLGTFSVVLNASRTVDSLTVGGDDSLSFPNSYDLTIANTAGNPSAGTVLNDGTISMNSSLSLTDLTFQGNGSFGGTGTLVIGDSSSNRLRSSGAVITNLAGHTIRGAGQILGNTGGMINQGTLIAEGANEMRIDPSGLGFTNQGTMTAKGAGGFDFQSGTFTNTGKTIEIQDGSKLDLNSSVTLVGGTVQNTGTGRVNILGSGTSLTLNAVTFEGTVTQGNAYDAYIVGGLTNGATWNMNSSLSLTDITIAGNNSIGGSGQIVMGDSSSNRLLSNGATITHLAGHTIRGAGQILSNTGGMLNQGTLIAEGANEMRIDPSGLGFTNQGTMTAKGAGGFDFQAGTFTNTGRTIEIQDGSKLDLNSNVNLVGGTLDNTGTGKVNILGSAASLTLNSVTFEGTVTQGNAYDAYIVGGLTNDATWNMNSSLSLTDLTIAGNNSIGGSGQIVMSDSSSNRLVSNSATITHLAGHTIRGAGQILGNTGGMLNQGTLIAEGANEMRIDPSGLGFTNQGTMTATGAGGFDFQPGTFTNTGQTIEIQDGSKLDLNSNVTLVDGTVHNTGTGRVNIFGSGTSLTLDAVTFEGTVTQGNAYDAYIVGGVTNNATWNMNSSLSFTDITIAGNNSIGGSGRIVLSDSSSNRLLSNGATITNLAAHTIRGAGQILGNTGGMLNQGTLIADGANAMRIDPSGLGFTNQGTMTAKGTGGLTIVDGTGTIFSTSGDVTVEAGSRLEMQGTTSVYTQTDGSTIVNGSLTAATRVDIGGGLLGGNGTVFGDVRNFDGGTVAPGNSYGLLTFIDNYTQNATSAMAVEIGGFNQGVNYDLLEIGGIAMLDGRLDVEVDLEFALDTLSVDDTFQILLADSGVQGEFSDVNVNLDGLELEQIVGPYFVSLRVTTNNVVPEPSTLVLLVVGGLTVVAVKRRRRVGGR